MPGRAHSLFAVLRLLTGFAVLSVLAGLLMAGIGIPVAGAVGSVATSGVKAFEDLPSDFEINPLAQQSKILDADGNVIANPYDENRIIVSLDQISPWMQKAQIAIEDSRFYSHGGLDLRGFTRAVVSNFSGGEVQGASTLTQQYVKITQQENALRAGDEEAAKAAVAKNYMRKLQELKYAMNVEENYTKDQILQGYLNLVYYGDQAYGVEAASQNYFAIPSSDLNLSQAALLAGIVQQPTKFNPVLNPEEAQARRDVVLSRMEELGMATPEEVAEAKSIDVASMLHRKEAKGTCYRSSEPYFCAFVMAWLERSPHMAALGATPEERLKNVNQGGLTIRTTLRPGMQQIAMARITEAVPIGNDKNLGAAATIIEPGTGKVLAMAQSSDYSQTQVVWNADQEFGGGPFGWQFGSTAKIYALVTALERGMPLDATIYAPPSGHQFTPDQVIDECGFDKPWKVRGGGKGSISLQQATSSSVNTAFAGLVLSLGACSVRDTMTRVGLHASNGDPIEGVVSAVALGAGTTTPMTMAASTATLAARGVHCEPYPVTSITTADQQEIEIPQSACEQVVTPEVADGVNKLLQGPLRNGTAAGSWNWSRPAAGKTGTTDDNNQSWFVGYTPQLSTAVWIGNVIPADGGRVFTLNGKCFGIYGCRGQVSGGTIAAPVWGKIMAQASEGMPVVDFTPPPSRIVTGERTAIPKVSGMTQAAALLALQQAGFTGYVSGQASSSVRKGLVAGTTPSGEAPRGSAIGLIISSGAPAPPPQEAPSEDDHPADQAAAAPLTDPGQGRGQGRGRGNGPPRGNG